MATRSQLLRRDQILAALVEIRQNIVVEASGLSDEEQEQVFLGIWSIRHLLAHLTGWDHTNLDAVKSVLDERVPAFYQHRDGDWQTYNAILVKKYGKDSFKELIASVKTSHKKLIEFLQTIPPENFNKDFGVRFRGYKVTIQRLLAADARDEQVHYRQIADFFKDSN